MTSNFLFSQSIVWVLFIGCTLFACEKEGEYNPNPNLKPKLSVNGQIDPNFGVFVRVSKSVVVGKSASFDTLSVSNAIVQIESTDGINANLIQRGEGTYSIDTGQYKIFVNKSYRIKVSGVANYPATISNFVKIPLPPKEIKEVNVWKNGVLNGDLPMGDGRIRFSDDLSNNDTYLVRCLGQSANFRRANTGATISLLQLCEIAAFLGLPESSFRDNCIAGSKEVKIKLASILWGVNNNNRTIPADRLYVYFGTVSPDYHDYLYSLVQPEDIEKGLAEPKPSYTNINGGIGIVYCTNLKEQIIEL